MSEENRIYLDLVGFAHYAKAINTKIRKGDEDLLKKIETASHSFYEVDALPEFTEGHEYKVGDVCIVTIPEDGVADGFKTAYHCISIESGLAWKAMAGNYNAKNVYYDKDIQVTKSVGNITTSNNKPVDLEFKGKNMEEVWQYLYATEDTDITVTQPSASFQINGSTSKTISGEIGTKFETNPILSVSMSDGTYEYGSKDASGNSFETYAGVTYSSAAIYLNGNTTALKSQSDSNTTLSYTHTLSEAERQITDTERSWTFNAKVSCPASSRYPVTNLGNFIDLDKNPTKDISKATKNTSAQTDKSLGERTFKIEAGWRGCFWGYKTDSTMITDLSTLDSTKIRGLGSGALESIGTITQTLDKMRQIFVAFPKGKYSNIEVKNTDLGAPQTVKKLENAISVNGAEGYTAIEYDLYYVNLDNADSKSYKYEIKAS